jgi:hypothetical protein
MDYTALLTKTWETVWNNKYLIILGVIVALLSGGGGGSPNFNTSFDSSNFGNQDFQGDFESVPNPFADVDTAAVGAVIAISIAVLCVVIVISLGLSYIARVANGGLIGGVNTLEGGGVSSFSHAWGLGWERGLPLFLINLVVSIPGFVFLLVVLGIVLAFLTTQGAIIDPNALLAANTGLIITGIVALCLTILISLPLAALQFFADRAAVIEGTGVFESFSRGWEVLRNNFGEAFLLFLITIAVRFMLGLALLVPSVIIACCCFLWPVGIALAGLIETYFSSLWTLAYLQWTGKDSPASRDVAPAV